MAGVKRIARVLNSKWEIEGRGARVRRSIGGTEIRNLDPFLLLDEFGGNSADGAGFPDHSHRGFDSVTYMLEGSFLHEDSTGVKGTLRAGDIQWITTGRGVAHSEMPGPEDSRGTQLWINLKSKDKMVEPNYQDFLDKDIPRNSQDGVHVKVIAGEAMGTPALAKSLTPVYYLHFTLDPKAKAFDQKIPKDWTTFAYTLGGKVKLGSEQQVFEPHTTVIFDTSEEAVRFENASQDEKAELLLIAGEPIGEPIARGGPIVMNTEEEVAQARKDKLEGKNGFESALGWESENGRALLAATKK